MSVEAPLGATPQSAAFELTSSARRRAGARAAPGRARTWREHAAIASVVEFRSSSACVHRRHHTNALVPQSIRPVSATSMAGPLSFLGFNLGVPSRRGDRADVRRYLFAVNYVELVSTRT